MFCTQCGNEIQDDSKFCCHCGAAIMQSEKDDDKETLKAALEKKKRKYGLGIGIGLGSLLLASVLIAIVMRSNGKDMTEAEVVSKIEEEEETEDAEKIGEVTEGNIEKEVEDGSVLLVCVPVEYMSLRSSPGLGDDVIAQLSAGTYLKWYGETVVDNEADFYKVIVRDTGQEGYVAAKYCVNVEFEPDESELIVVETNDALYTYDMMVSDIKTLCEKYPDRLDSRVIGTSIDGRDIYEVVLGNPEAENHIMLQAGIHGREYITSQLIMKMLEYYAFYYENGEYGHVLYKDLFNKTAIHAVPMSNPDGVTISQLGVGAMNESYMADFLYECYERDKGTLIYKEDTNGDMNWYDYYQDANYDRVAAGDTREITFEEYQTIWKANANGVDLNNNFEAEWDSIALKEYPAYGSFKGYYPLSEPESQALAELALEREYRCFLSYHSRGQLIYYDVAGNSPENSIASENFVNLLENCIKYEPVNTQKGYNVNLGGFGDWVQLSLGKPSVTIENGKKPCPLGIEEFPAIWLRNRESWAMLGHQFYS